MGTLLNDFFFQIDARIGGIIFMGLLITFFHPVREKAPFWGHC
jgi:hypothetical protein